MSAIGFVLRVIFRGAVSGTMKFVVSMAAVCAALWLVIAALEVIWLAPWAYSFGGKPALVGSWVGRFQTPSGASGGVLLDVHHSVGDGFIRRSGGSGNALLRGEEGWCFAGGGRFTATLRGSANPSADRVVVAFDPGRTPQTGIYFMNLTGSWAADRLRITGTARTFRGGKWLFSPNTADGKTATVFDLRRGDTSAFESLCAELH